MSEQNFDVVALADIHFLSATPMVRNKKGTLLHNPHFTIEEGGMEYHFAGRDVMWSYLDSLFPGDPLPRNSVEDDIFAPVLGSPSLYTLLVELTKESFDEGNEYLVLFHEDNKVQMVRSLTDFSMTNDIEAVGTVLQATFSATPTYRPFKYRDRTGVSLRPSVHVSLPYYTVLAIDLGKRWYIITLSKHTKDEGPIALHSPKPLVKHTNDLRDSLYEVIQVTADFVDYVTEGEGRMPAIIREAPAESAFRTNEYHELLHLRWVKPGVHL
jgi:hypothetical protein